MRRAEKIAEVYAAGERFGIRLLKTDQRGEVVELVEKGTRDTFTEAWIAAEAVADVSGGRVRYDDSEQPVRRNYGVLVLSAEDENAFAEVEQP